MIIRTGEGASLGNGGDLLRTIRAQCQQDETVIFLQKLNFMQQLMPNVHERYEDLDQLHFIAITLRSQKQYFHNYNIDVLWDQNICC